MARPDDLEALQLLIREHALFERAAAPDGELVRRLESLLFSPAPRLHAIVAEGDGGLAGYATASLEVSTWQASEFLHLDCLYLRAGARGAGVGRRILDRVRVLACELGASEVQWQTPGWNDDAVRFYEREGAVGRDKKRFTLDVTRDRARA